MVPFYLKNVDLRGRMLNFSREIYNLIYIKIGELKAEYVRTCEPISHQESKRLPSKPIEVGEKWGDLWDCAWFRFTFPCLKDLNEKHYVARIDISGEGCVYNRLGEPTQAITNVIGGESEDFVPYAKQIVDLNEEYLVGDMLELTVDAGCNDLFGRYINSGKLMCADVCVCNDIAFHFYYDFITLYGLSKELNPDSARCGKIVSALENSMYCIRDFSDDELILADAVLKEELDRKNIDSPMSVNAIGHAHLDLAWLWPIRETKRKTERTLSTQVNLFKKYPEYVFGISQPQQLFWLKERSPKLYEQVKRFVAQGRIELQGGMWVECDTNIPCGESLIRQFLYGKKYYRDEFGVDVKTCWLPDVFGYTYALPQIMKKCGCDYFLTIKLSWNDINRFPYNTFNWEGTDGSTVLVHMPPLGNYNSRANSHEVIQTEYMNQNSDCTDEAILLFGIGDGGGGPGVQHLEQLKRLQNLQSVPPVHFGKAVDFFKKAEKNRDKYPKYKGELYLERHQGTFTTQARNKRYNRECEKLLHYAEAIIALKGKQSSELSKELEIIWKEVLLYQFHDILPGSSIARVYKESTSGYLRIIEQLNKLIQSICSEDKRGVPFNAISWERKYYEQTETGIKQLTVAAYSNISIESKDFFPKFEKSENFIGNGVVRVWFTENCEMRQIEYGGKNIWLSAPGNQLNVYTDRGDCWDMDINYRKFPVEKFVAYRHEEKVLPLEVVRKNYYRYNRSTLIETVRLRCGSCLVEVDTECDWQEKDKMLRADFYTGIQSDECVCDIQFGHIKRSTYVQNLNDYAQFEIPAQKFIAVNDGINSLALFSDSKYGYYCRDNCISINLLRSQNFPGKEADLGEQKFQYALYPQEKSGNLIRTIRASYEYNNDLIFRDSEEIRLPIQFKNENLIIETVKPCEKGNSVSIRVYEASGNAVECFALTDFNKYEVVEMDMLEQEEIQSVSAESVLHFKPFEIKTFMLKNREV